MAPEKTSTIMMLTGDGNDNGHSGSGQDDCGYSFVNDKVEWWSHGQNFILGQTNIFRISI